MILLSIGLILFLGAHSVPMSGSIRQLLIARFGNNPYQIVFTLVSLLGILMIVWGKATAAVVDVWQPPAWGRHITMTCMLLALILLPAANMSGNIKRYVRHPMLAGVILWSAGHLAANGDLASLLLFGSFALYSILDMWSANSRGALRQKTRLPLSKDVMVVVAGVATYAVLLVLHPYLFGVSVV